MSPLSSDPERRAAQLANLRSAPPAPEGNARTRRHGAHSEILLRDVETELVELMQALGDGAPVRDEEDRVPMADLVAVERAARALKRYRTLASWLDMHGRIDERSGKVKPAAELELKCERELAAALAALGMDPRSRAALGLDLARAASRPATLADFIEGAAA